MSRDTAKPPHAFDQYLTSLYKTTPAARAKAGWTVSDPARLEYIEGRLQAARREEYLQRAESNRLYAQLKAAREQTKPVLDLLKALEVDRSSQVAP